MKYEYWFANLMKISCKRKLELRQVIKTAEALYYIEETALKQYVENEKERDLILDSIRAWQLDEEYQKFFTAPLLYETSVHANTSGIFKSFSDAPNGMKEELEEIQWSVGAEYIYHDKFALRAGYHHEAENKGNRKYFTLGAGFKMNVFSLDVGYVIATAKSNPLDQTLRFSLAFDMDGIKDIFQRR